MKTSPTNGEILDQLPPQNLDAERGALGSCVLDPRKVDDVADLLRVDDFHADANRKLFAAIVAMHEAGQPIDTVTLRDALKNRGELEAVGGLAYLAEVVNSVPYAANGMYYAQIVRAKAESRRLIHAGIDLLQSAHGGGDPAQLAARAEAAIGAALERPAGEGLVDAKGAIVEAMAAVERIREKREGTGLLTGVEEFDEAVGGLFPGELTILAARPRMGKTALANQIAIHAAERGRGVLFASLEMAAAELMTRTLCGRSGVDSRRIRTGTMTDGDVRTLVKAGTDLASMDLQILDSPGATVAGIRRAARKARRSGDLQLVVIDYLQLIEPDDPRVPRHEQVARIARALKGLARELQLPVLCLAQVNRQTESAGDHRPRLGHLRESGAIEQDADVVLFIHRAEVYDDDPDLRGKAELITAKNRNGPCPTIRLQWDATTTTFSPERATAWDEFAPFAPGGPNA